MDTFYAEVIRLAGTLDWPAFKAFLDAETWHTAAARAVWNEAIGAAFDASPTPPLAMLDKMDEIYSLNWQITLPKNLITHYGLPCCRPWLRKIDGKYSLLLIHWMRNQEVTDEFVEHVFQCKNGLSLFPPKQAIRLVQHASWSVAGFNPEFLAILISAFWRSEWFRELEKINAWQAIELLKPTKSECRNLWEVCRQAGKTERMEFYVKQAGWVIPLETLFYDDDYQINTHTIGAVFHIAECHGYTSTQLLARLQHLRARDHARLISTFDEYFVSACIRELYRTPQYAEACLQLALTMVAQPHKGGGLSATRLHARLTFLLRWSTGFIGNPSVHPEASEPKTSKAFQRAVWLAAAVMVADGTMILGSDPAHPVVRFLRIASQLPYEIQELLTHGTWSDPAAQWLLQIVIDPFWTRPYCN
jgi:hypothetical protein